MNMEEIYQKETKNDPVIMNQVSYSIHYIEWLEKEIKRQTENILAAQTKSSTRYIL
jgi:hypothetical protein